MKKGKSLLQITGTLVLFVLLVVSCAKETDYRIYFWGDDGNLRAAEKSLLEMFAVFEEKSEPYIWDSENLVLTVGEISPEIEPFGEDTDLQYVLEFEEEPEGLILVEATMVIGEHGIPKVLDYPDVAPTEYFDMTHVVAANLASSL